MQSTQLAEKHVHDIVYFVNSALAWHKDIGVLDDGDSYKNDTFSFEWVDNKCIFRYNTLQLEWEGEYEKTLRTNMRISPKKAVEIIHDCFDSLGL